MRLQKHIIRILREDEYSPAGKEIIPNKIVVHKTSPAWRENILKTGLLVDVGDCYKTYVGYGEKCIPAIFATNSTNKRAWFDSSYNDDVWAINTELIPNVKWYKDRHFESSKKHIVTFENIPPKAIELIHEGNGRSLWRESDKDKLSKETMMDTFQEIVDETLEEIKNICEVVDADTFPDWLSFDGCDVVDTIDKISILNVEITKGISRIPMFEVDVNLTINGIWGGIDYDDFMYNISDRIINKWRIRFSFNIKEQENSNKRKMWESAEHKKNTRKLLREETNLISMIRRRVPPNDLEREFKESLDMSSNMLFNLIKNGGGVMGLDRFIDVTTSILIDGIHYEIYSTMPLDSEWYQDVKKSLKNYFKNRIKTRYRKLISEI